MKHWERWQNPVNQQIIPSRSHPRSSELALILWQCQEMGIPVLSKERHVTTAATKSSLQMLAEPDARSSGWVWIRSNPTRHLIREASQNSEETTSLGQQVLSLYKEWPEVSSQLWCCHSSGNLTHNLHPFHFNHWVNSIPQFIDWMTRSLPIKSEFQTRNPGKVETPGTQNSCIRFTKHTFAHLDNKQPECKTTTN